MLDFNNSDYILRWPPGLLKREVERLIQRGKTLGTDRDWVSEVECLLKQAFISSIPTEDFRKVKDGPTRTPTYEEEPF